MTTDLKEKLAALEHDRWARWQKHLHSKCAEVVGGNSGAGALVIPANLVARWERQIATPYAELSEAEKDMDRVEAEKTLGVVEEYASAAGRSAVEKATGELLAMHESGARGEEAAETRRRRASRSRLRTEVLMVASELLPDRLQTLDQHHTNACEDAVRLAEHLISLVDKL